MKIDLGCGRSKRAGYIGVDILTLPNVDIVHDLNAFPYPFDDATVEEIWLDQVLEHLNDPMRAVEEIWRICKNNAKVFVGVPYFRSFYAVMDPTHRSFFSVQWFDYFDPEKDLSTKYAYSHARFSINRIEFDREYKQDKLSLLRRMLIRFAERRPITYESRFSHLLPLNSLTFHLNAIK